MPVNASEELGLTHTRRLVLSHEDDNSVAPAVTAGRGG